MEKTGANTERETNGFATHNKETFDDSNDLQIRGGLRNSNPTPNKGEHGHANGGCEENIILKQLR